MGMASLVFGVSLMMVFAYLNAVRKIDLFSLPK